MFPVIPLLLGSLSLVLVAARLSGRIYLMVVVLVSPVLLAVTGSILADSFDLSIPGALFLAIPLLGLSTGLIHQIGRRTSLPRRIDPRDAPPAQRD